MTGVSKCELHIPHKEWAQTSGLEDGHKDRINWLELERWARQFFKECLPEGGGEGALIACENGTAQEINPGSSNTHTLSFPTVSADKRIAWSASFWFDGDSDGLVFFEVRDESDNCLCTYNFEWIGQWASPPLGFYPVPFPWPSSGGVDVDSGATPQIKFVLEVPAFSSFSVSYTFCAQAVLADRVPNTTCAPTCPSAH